MRDILKDILIGLLGAWILEQLPRLALAVVRLAARLMPTPELRRQMLDDWTAEVRVAVEEDGAISALFASIAILWNARDIGDSTVSYDVDLDLNEVLFAMIHSFMIINIFMISIVDLVAMFYSLRIKLPDFVSQNDKEELLMGLEYIHRFGFVAYLTIIPILYGWFSAAKKVPDEFIGLVTGQLKR